MKETAKALKIDLGGIPTHKIHEDITRRLILYHPDLRGPLSENDRHEIIKLLEEGLGDQLNKDIVSGPLDADKQDYLLRDSYFCGVRYGIYDIDQLHNTLVCGPDGALMVEEGGLHALEQFVMAKYYLTTQVYRHKVRLITDNMLIRGISLGILQDRHKVLHELYVYNPESEDFLAKYLTWDDRRLIQEMLHSDYDDTYAGDMFRRLHKRELFKRIFSMRISDVSVSMEVSTLLPEKFDSIRVELEAAIADRLSSELDQLGHSTTIDPNHVILHQFRIENVRTQSRNSERTIMVLQKDQSPVTFEEQSTLFSSINESLSDEWLECYAPLPLPLEERKKRELLVKMENWILDLIKDHLKP